jgi:hypothetical protein
MQWQEAVSNLFERESLLNLPQMLELAHPTTRGYMKPGTVHNSGNSRNGTYPTTVTTTFGARGYRRLMAFMSRRSDRVLGAAAG